MSVADGTPYEALAELVVAAPGRRAPLSALQTLRQLADDGDFGAVVALSRILAWGLGHDSETRGLVSAATLEELARASDVSPLVRLYALGFVPRVVISGLPEWLGLARELGGHDELPALQSLVRRNSVLADEALRAFVLAGYVAAHGPTAFGTTPGEQLSTLEKVMSGARVVPGHAADATFEFGRDFLLDITTDDALIFVIVHEVAHHILNWQWASTATTDEELPVLLAALCNVLPMLASAGRSLTGQPMSDGDPRWWRSAGEISVHCSWQTRPGGAYTHVSMSDHDGPIELGKACALALVVVRVLGGNPTEAVVVHSRRGVFHVGLAGELPSDAALAEAARSAHLPSREEALEWFGTLSAAGRVGGDESDIRYLLGVDPRPPRVFAPDGPATVQDLAICRELADRGGDLSEAGRDELAEFVRRALRAGNPTVLADVLAAAREKSADLGEAGLSDLGRSCCVLRTEGELIYGGPTVSHLNACLAALHAAGVGLGGPVTDTGDSLLTDAAMRHESLVESLLAVGVPIEAANAAGDSPLAVASAFGARDCAVLLLDAGAAVDARNCDGLTPLHHAATSHSEEICALLLDHRAQVDARSAGGETPLMAACSAAVAERLIDGGADVDATSLSGQTALIAAAADGRVDVVRVLLEAGADPEMATDLGYVALHRAVLAANDVAQAIVVALLDAGAEVDEETDEGITPLMIAAEHRRAELVALLLARGANANARSPDGRTPLGLARAGEDEKTIEALLAMGACDPEPAP